jgi:TFIIF-interacting CTD phosphatase-like protein
LKLLILDLDETLIHATDKPLEREADFQTERYYVYKRPDLEKFLRFCQDNFQVGIWTSGGSDFAKTVVKNIFPENYLLQFVWSRKRCTKAYDSEKMKSYYLKNLAKLKRRGYSLDEIIMVDDTPQKLQKNYGNLVRITKWLGDLGDIELLQLSQYLLDFKDVINVRTIEKRGWQTRYKL